MGAPKRQPPPPATPPHTPPGSRRLTPYDHIIGARFVERKGAVTMMTCTMSNNLRDF